MTDATEIVILVRGWVLYDLNIDDDDSDNNITGYDASVVSWSLLSAVWFGNTIFETTVPMLQLWYYATHTTAWTVTTCVTVIIQYYPLSSCVRNMPRFMFRVDCYANSCHTLLIAYLFGVTVCL